MANKFRDNAGYAVVETNDVAAVRTGRMKAQYPTKDGVDLENGMLVVVNEKEKQIELPGAEYSGKFALHASEERLHESHLGRNAFILKGETQIPRVLLLEDGDVFETSAIATETIEDYGVPAANGLIDLVADVTGQDMYLEVVEEVTLPNGKPGIKFAVKFA